MTEVCQMKRLVVLASLVASLALPASTLAFHHGQLPSTFCANENADSPSNRNGRAREAISEHNPQGLPLPPVGTPGEGQGRGEEHCEGR